MSMWERGNFILLWQIYFKKYLHERYYRNAALDKRGHYKVSHSLSLRANAPLRNTSFACLRRSNMFAETNSNRIRYVGNDLS